MFLGCLLFPFLSLSLLFLFAGFLFAFFLTIPIANHYLMSFNEEIGVNLWAFANYLDYTIILLLAHGLAFEICVVLLFLVHFGFLTAEKMRAKRSFFAVGAFILSAVLTPPDVLTQLMLAFPLIFLYEVAIFYAFLREKRQKELLSI